MSYVSPPSLVVVLATDDRTSLPDHAIALDKYMHDGQESEGGGSCGSTSFEQVYVVVPPEAFTHLWTLVHGGHVSGMVLATVVGTTMLEDLFAWARMWNDRRFVHAASEALLFQRGLIGLGNDIHRCCAQFLDARHGASVMMGGDRVLEYREKAMVQVGGNDHNERGVQRHQRRSAVFAVDDSVRLIVFVHAYIVFVRLTPFQDGALDLDDAGIDDATLPRAVSPFDTTQNNIEFHGHCMIYEGDHTPLKYVPLL